MILKTLSRVAGLCLLASAAIAAPLPEAAPAPAELTASDLGAFADGVLPEEMGRAGVNGVSLAVGKRPAIPS